MDMTPEQESALDEWVAEREESLFKVQVFKSLNKQDDSVFQALVFLSNGSQQLSLATIVLSEDTNVPEELRDELKNIQRQLHELKDELRKYK